MLLKKHVWTKSTKTQDMNCVEVKYDGEDQVLVRNSNRPEIPAMPFTKGEWEAFLSGAQEGEFRLA